MRLKRILTFLWLTLFAVIGGMLIASLVSGYALLECLTAIKVEQQSFISLREFHSLQIVLVVWIAVLLMAAAYAGKIVPGLMLFMQFVWHSFPKLVREMRHHTGWFVLVIPLLCALCYAIAQPVTFEEAWTYVRFISGSPVSTMTLDPEPHNHMLFSFIAYAIHWLPFLPSLILFRIPSIVVAILSWSLLYYGIRKWNGEQPAMIVTAMASMLFMSVYYSYIGSGYGLVVFFFILAAIATWNITQHNQVTTYMKLYAVASGLGCFTTPTFVLVVLSCSLLLIFVKHLPKITWLKYHGLIAALCALLYAPVVIVNGYEQWMQRQWVSVISFHIYRTKISSFWYQTLSEITGLLGALLLFLIVVTAIYLVIKKNLRLLGVLVVFFLVPTISLVMQSVVAYPQTFIYYGCMVAFIILFPLFQWISGLGRRWILIMAVLIQGVLWFFFHERIRKYDAVYDEFHMGAREIMDQDKRYYFNSELFPTTFLFEMKTHHRNMQHAVYHQPQVAHPVNTDTISGFDYIVLDKAIDQTQQRKPIFTGERISIYQEKE